MMSEEPQKKQKPARLRGFLLAVGGGALLACFVWSYWTTLGDLVGAWEREADYSHGYLVLPFALLALWLRRDSFPTGEFCPAWSGLILLGLGVVLRGVAAFYRMTPVDGWCIPLWVAGCVWLLGGRRILLWSLPSIAFLVFMVPLPYRVERWVGTALQKICTVVSCFLLNLFGQPALAEGNTILLGEHHFGVHEACSGLRIFVGIVALAAAFGMVTRGPWWEKILLIASALPVALLANSIRVVTTTLLYQYDSTAAGRTFNHDVSGWAMIPLAAIFFLLGLWFWRGLLPEVEYVDIRELVNSQRL